MNKKSYNITNTPFKTGIQGKCPRCQKGAIFSGYLKIAPKCNVCGLDYSFSDTADGPAFFSMSIVMPLSMAVALWLEIVYSPPLWVHLLTTLPITGLACLYFLRRTKGWLFCAEYVHEARDGTLEPQNDFDKQ